MDSKNQIQKRQINFRAWDGECMLTTLDSITLEELRVGIIDESDDGEIKTTEVIYMQYAGLKDKNGKGKEIFVGDILSEKWKVEVYQSETTGTFMVKFHTNPKVNKPRTLYEFLHQRYKAGTGERDCVVIGNVFENPELLTK